MAMMRFHRKYLNTVKLSIYTLVAASMASCGGGNDDNILTKSLSLDTPSGYPAGNASSLVASATAAPVIMPSANNPSSSKPDESSATAQTTPGAPGDASSSQSDLSGSRPTSTSAFSIGKPDAAFLLKASDTETSTAPPDARPVWTKVAGENELFTLVEQRAVRYGSGTASVEKLVIGNAQCSAKFFGTDSIPGTARGCFARNAVTIPSVAAGGSGVGHPVAATRRVKEISLAACSTTPVVTTSDFTKLSVAVGRASGVAPLAVFFDATGTVSNNTARPFHEIEYRWNFGETSGPGIGQWNQGSAPGVSSRNATTGPVAGHIFETPGIYTVTVGDAAKTVSYQCGITVQSPEVEFSGARTTCFSTSGTFSGCPAGASLVKTSDFAVVKNAVTPTNSVRRLLLRRGETWTVDKTAVFSADGPGLIGAFGTGLPPVISPTAAFPSSESLLAFSSSTTPTIKDWRLMDIKLDASSRSQDKLVGVTGLGGIDQLTLLRVNTDSFRLSLDFSDSLLDVWNRDTNPIRHGHHIWNQLSIVDMDIVNMPTGIPGDTSTWSYGTYLGAEQLFFAGTAIDGYGTASQGVSHNTRFTYLGKASISNNTFQRPGPSEHNIKLHAAPWSDTGVSGMAGVGQGYTRWVVISDNKFVGAAGAWPIAVGPPDNVADIRGKDIILERNWQVAGGGTRVSQLLWWSDITSRNNIFDMSAGSAKTGIYVGKRGPGQMAPDRISIFNNTFFSSSTDNDFVAVEVDSNAGNVVIKNNLAFAPNALRRLMVSGIGSAPASVVATYNSADLGTDPLFVGNTADAFKFKLQNGSYAIGAGTQVPVFSDFLSALKPPVAAPEIGAISY